MIELLVTLVLLGLVAAMVAPGLDAWLAARQAAALRMEISSELAMLPLIANRSGQAMIIDSPAKLKLNDVALTFTQPVIVNANGFCQGGQFELLQNNKKFSFAVLAPFCEVRRVAAN